MIQWNFRGLKVNFIEITLLVEAFLPVAFCLQETYLKKSDNINLKKIPPDAGITIDTIISIGKFKYVFLCFS
jgi:hypothetical protein